MNEIPPIRIIIIEAQSETAISTVLREIGGVDPSKRVFIERVETMGDTYNISGQAGAVGPNSSSEGNIFYQYSQESMSEADLALLAEQLDNVRLAMKTQAAENGSTAEQDEEIGDVAKAQIAANNGDKEAAFSHLRRLGSWTLAVAKTTGAEILALTLAHLTTGH